MQRLLALLPALAPAVVPAQDPASAPAGSAAWTAHFQATFVHPGYAAARGPVSSCGCACTGRSDA